MRDLDPSNIDQLVCIKVAYLSNVQFFMLFTIIIMTMYGCIHAGHGDSVLSGDARSEASVLSVFIRAAKYSMQLSYQLITPSVTFLTCLSVLRCAMCGNTLDVLISR
jgi:hypothetical protein